ncbi:MAG: hypothetical protein ACKVP2_09450 [Burkholderiales bacterium]
MEILRFMINFRGQESGLVVSCVALVLTASSSFGAMLCRDSLGHEACIAAMPAGVQSGMETEDWLSDAPREFNFQGRFHPGGRHDSADDPDARTGIAFRLARTLREADDRAMHTQESPDLGAWIGQYIDTAHHDKSFDRRGAGHFWKKEFSEAARQFAENRRRHHGKPRHRHRDHYHHDHEDRCPYFPNDGTPVPAAVPLPASVGLLAAGSFLLGGIGLRRRGRAGSRGLRPLSSSSPRGEN